MNAVRPGRAESELAREIASHLALLEDEYQRRGMTADEARFAARRAIGGIEQAKEHQRDARSFRWLGDARLDARHAWRTLRRMPGFTTVAVLTLALGIGATTAIFSVVNAVLLRPLPYKDSDRLVRILEHVPATDGSTVPSRRVAGLLLSELISIRSQAATLLHLGGYAGSTLLLTGRDETIRLEATRLSPAVFAMLGTQPLIGRTFDAAEETPGQDSVAVLSYASWQRYFAGARDVLDQRMTLDGRVYSVVGVMPRDFQFPDSQTQLWIPFALNGSRALPVARLADGVSIDAATGEVAAILSRMPASAQPRRSGPRQFALERVQEELVAPVRPALGVLAVAVGFVLLIACANVANLELARDASRQREIAVRLALGAGRARLIRQLFTESALLALVGAAAGVAIAVGGVQLLRTLGASLPRGDLAVGVSIPRLEEITIDLPVLAFTLVAAIVTAIVSGLAPAIHQSRSSETDVLREGTASASSGFNLFRRHRMQGLLIVAEIAMAMLLLVGGGLLIHSFVNLSNVDPGYDPSRILTFQLPMGNPNAYYALRTHGDPTASIASIKSLVRQIDPRSTIDNVATMERIVSNSIGRQRQYAALLGIFAAVAVALAAIGIYGVMAYAVAQRTREIGIRMALGAPHRTVMRLVLGQGAGLTAMGIAFGLAGAAAMTRYLDTMLFGLTPLDPATFVVVSLMFATIATLASYAPARRATKVDPLVALRHE